MKQEREPVGTCFLQHGTKTVEYAPCRSSMYDKRHLLFTRGPAAQVLCGMHVCVCVYLYDKICRHRGLYRAMKKNSAYAKKLQR